MMTDAEVLELARAAGRAGRDWMAFTADDALADYCADRADTFDADVIRVAFDEGRREWRSGGGWVTRYTTAPAEFDGFQTETAAELGEYKGKALRKVLIDPRYVDWHECRYGSGLHGSWVEDPREVERKIADRLERDRLERERRATARDEGLAWLQQITDAELESAIESDTLESDHAFGIDYRDARAERKRRTEARADAARETRWATLRARIPDGATILDDGAPATQGRWGRIPGRDARVHYAITVESWQRDADTAMVRDAAGVEVGSLAHVVEYLQDGRLRVAGAGDIVPPRPVVERVGHARWRSIKRLELDGRIVWAHSPMFSSDVVALDDHGRKVRGKAIQEAAVFAYWKAT